MKYCIVYCHPYEKSYCSSVLKSVTSGLEKAGHDYDVIDLIKDNFNPVMTSADLLAFRNRKAVDEQAIGYIGRIKQADHMVFVFPIWWGLMPAIMKGFVDKVIFPGEAYNYTESGNGMYSLIENIKSAAVITTMNSPWWYYALFYGNAIKRAFIKGTLAKIGIRKVKWVKLDNIKGRGEDKRKQKLQKIEKLFSAK